MTFPNPHRPAELLSYKRVKIGGRWIKAALAKVDGNEIEDNWDEQKPTGQSGAKYVFKGTKPPAKQTWTFRTAHDGFHTPEEMFDDLMQVYDLLEPKRGLGGSGTATTPAAPGSQWTLGSSSGGSSSSGSSSSSPTSSGSTSTSGSTATASGSSSTSSNTDSSSSSSSSSKTPDPGPKPPTLSVESAYLLRFGVTAISRAKWKGPTFIESNGSWEVEITVVPQQPPIPAGVGAAAPKTPDQFTLGAGGSGGANGNDPAAQAKKDVDNAGAQ